MLRVLLLAACAVLLVACAPRFDWRTVVFGAQGASGVLPDKPQVQTHDVTFEGTTLALTMHTAHAGHVLFALGAAPLPPPWQADAAAQQRLAQWAMANFYRNAGLDPPANLPAPGERFVIEGHGAKGPLRFEVQVKVTDREWLEAVAVAAPHDFDRAPVDDFWLSLRWAETAPR